MLFVSPAMAASLTVTVRDAGGQPVRDAVVAVQGAGGVGPIRFDWLYRMSQHNLQFDPFVLVVPVGADVDFPNRDKVRHHVYSFSPAKKFQLKLYGQEEKRTVNFDKAGIVALGCNIHDQMIGFIDVVDTPFAAKTDDSGRAVLPGNPQGNATLTVWHPYMRAPGNVVSRKVSLAASGAAHEDVAIDVRPAPMKGMKMTGMER